jgi:hypothetical protein
MNRVTEFIVRFFLRQELLQKIEKEVREGEAPVCDVYLKEGTEYEFRGWVSPKDAGALELSLRNGSGILVPVVRYKRGFALVARKDGVYQVWATVRSTKGKEASGLMTVTINSGHPVRTPFDGMSFLSYLPYRPAPRNSVTDGKARQERAGALERKAG